MTQLSQHISHFLIGIPASGKSTFARWLQKQTQGQIISTDAIREQLYGDAAIQGDWSEISVVIDEQIQKAIATQTSIIYDATNFQRNWRQDFLAQYAELTWVAWHLQTPFEMCWHRNQKRSRQVPFEVMRQMAIALENESPTCEDGFIEIISILVGDHRALMALKKQHPQYLGD